MPSTAVQNGRLVVEDGGSTDGGEDRRNWRGSHRDRRDCRRNPVVETPSESYATAAPPAFARPFRTGVLMRIQLQVALTHLTGRKRRPLVSLTGVILGVAFFWRCP